ncbi:glycosyltransferase family 2 protein [Metabacillus halosaccharovorans]|uniref:glycosyltransferase family 2 protein n=1 Tax=Metabacillus halosaccharovorans TaxID=930124 RepID=UPI0034CDE1C1
MELNHSIFVSIVMPVYNREDTLKASIQSVLDQTYRSFEFIIVDDASTDQSAAVIQSFNDKRIKYIAHSENLGGSEARNTGVNNARGEWIAFQDSDDLWSREKLEKQIKVAVENIEQSPIIYTSFVRIKSGEEEIIPKKDERKKSGNIHKELMLGNFISTQTVLLPKKYLESVGGFSADMPRFQDWELWLRISEKFPFLWVDESLVQVYYTEGSISSDHRKIVIAYEKILSMHRSLFEKAGPKYLGSFLFSYGHNLCLAGDCKWGRSILLQSFKYNKSMKSILSIIVSTVGARFYTKIYKVMTKGRFL